MHTAQWVASMPGCGISRTAAAGAGAVRGSSTRHECLLGQLALGKGWSGARYRTGKLAHTSFRPRLLTGLLLGNKCKSKHHLAGTQQGVSRSALTLLPAVLMLLLMVMPLLLLCVFASQHVDTGELLMQAYADRAALNETLQTK